MVNNLVSTSLRTTVVGVPTYYNLRVRWLSVGRLELTGDGLKPGPME